MKKFSEFLNESSLSRLWRKYKECDSGTISAFKGYRSYKENMEKHSELVAKLLGCGFSVTKIQGSFKENYKTKYEKEVNELSLIVFDHKKKGNLKKILLKLGAEYEQDSITYCDATSGNYYLIGCLDKTKVKDDDGNIIEVPTYPKKGVEVKLGKPMFGDSGEFFSKINGRPFIFKESFTNEIDMLMEKYQNNTKWYFRKLAKESLTEDEIA